MAASPGKLRATLHVGDYAFVDQGGVTVLYHIASQKSVLRLSSVDEYALARMLIEKTQLLDSDTRDKGETRYRDEVSVAGRTLLLS